MLDFPNARTGRPDMLQWLLRSLQIAGLATAISATATAEEREPLTHSPAIDVPFAPVVVNVGGVRRLVYELHLTNLRPHELVLSRIAVSEAASGVVYASDGGAALAGKIGRPGVVPQPADGRAIGGGSRAVWYAWISLRDDAAPRMLRHHIEYAYIRDGERQRARSNPSTCRCEAMRPP
jgi:murein DD-endopeptidase